MSSAKFILMELLKWYYKNSQPFVDREAGSVPTYFFDNLFSACFLIKQKFLNATFSPLIILSIDMS